VTCACYQKFLQKLGALATAAAIFMGGFGTGVASSNMFQDVQTAEANRLELITATSGPDLVQPASLTLPDQVGRRTDLCTAQLHSTCRSCAASACHQRMITCSGIYEVLLQYALAFIYCPES
jgi:hypothetical protein